MKIKLIPVLFVVATALFVSGAEARPYFVNSSTGNRVALGKNPYIPKTVVSEKSISCCSILRQKDIKRQSTCCCKMNAGSKGLQKET